MSIEIRRVESRRDLRKFINFQVELQKNYPNWVPALFLDELNTLSKDKNPAFEFCEAEYWLAYRDGKIVGRIAGIINQRVVEKWGKKSGRFGWMDFIEDFEVAEALVKTVEDWARSKGMEFVNGPLGFTDLDKEGLLIEGFDELGTMPMIYNPPYYPEYLERLGYGKDVDWLEFEVKIPDTVPEKATRVQGLISERSKIHLYDWKTTRVLKNQYAMPIFDLVDRAYAHLYGTTPLSEKQKEAYTEQYLGFADPRFVKLVVDAEDKLVAFGVAIPDLSRALQKCGGRLFPFGWYYFLRTLKHPEKIDMLLVAVEPSNTAHGAVAFLMSSIITSCTRAGVRLAETSGELEDNHQVRSLWNDFEHRQHKRRRAYLKKL
jgi:hypothetical protein